MYEIKLTEQNTIEQTPLEKSLKHAYSPYGYCYDPQSPSLMRIDDDTAKYVIYIFQQFLSGYELSAITTALTEMGAPSPNQRKEQLGYNFKKGHVTDYWSAGCLNSIITNPVYIGDHIYRRPRLPKHLLERIEDLPQLPSGTVLHDHHEAIISKDEFERAGILLRCQTEAFNAKRKPRKQNPTYRPPFCNTVFCGECGRPMYFKRTEHAGKITKTGYSCGSKMKNLALDCSKPIHLTSKLVDEAIIAVKAEREHALTVANAINVGVENEYYKKADETIRQKIADILDQIIETKICLNNLQGNHSLTPTELDNQTNTLNTKIDTLRQEVEQKQLEKAELITAFTTSNKWLTLFTEIPEDFVFDRDFSKKVISRVDVFSDGKIEVHLLHETAKLQILRYFDE